MPCLGCPGCTRRFVGGGGNTASPLVCIGTACGKNDKPGQPFTGFAARDFNDVILRSNHLYREDIWMTNVHSCYWEDQSKIDDAGALECASRHLRSELQNAEVVVVMGAIPNRVLLGIDHRLEHGFARRVTMFGWTGIVVPTIHPAETTHDPKVLGALIEDFKAVKDALTGTLHTAPRPPAHQRPIVDQWASDITLPAGEPVAIDTEWDPGDNDRPICLTYATQPDLGHLIYADNTKALREFDRQLNLNPHGPHPVLFHNQSEDIRMLRRMGVGVPEHKVVDTMQIAYHHCDIPQALKEAAYRLFGTDRLSYQDLVKPYHNCAVVGYVEEASRRVFPTVLNPKAKKPKPRPNPIMTKIKKLTASDPETWCDKVTKWKDRELLEAVNGPIPHASLELVPEQEMVEYAVADAVDTYRLYMKLRNKRVRKMF